MTLLELLRQELPKRGGWPEGAIKMTQDYDGELWCWSDDDRRNVRSFAVISEVADNHRKWTKREDSSCFVTREQYEATGWDGTGLPPVGCTCESSWAGDEWQLCEILFASNQFVVVNLKESGMEDAYNIGDVTFRPLRTEAERAIDEMVRLSGVSIGAAKILYDAGYRKG